MKLKDLRQKYNSLLQKCIRVFSLTGVAFVVTACYGVAPPVSDSEDYVDVNGQVLGENDEPLESIQVVVKAKDAYCEHSDTVYTSEKGNYRLRYTGNCMLAMDEIEIIANDTTHVYASDTVHTGADQITLSRMEDNCWGGIKYYSLDADFQLKKK